MSWLGFGSSSGSGDSSSTGAAAVEAVESAILESTKGALLKQLQMSIKELQVQFLDETTVITTDEASDRLLAIVEAIFIHGLKDSFLGVKGKGEQTLNSFLGQFCGKMKASLLAGKLSYNEL